MVMMEKNKIMVVEDESIVAEHIRRSLLNMGYSVTSVVSSGPSAIKDAEDKSPDLVLMDIVLDGEMDGIETAKLIRSRFNIPIVFLTAFSDENILQRAKITEPFGYVIKPFNDTDLRINIELALHNHKMEKKLKDSEQWLTATLKSLGEAVITTDKNGNIKTINPYAEILTGCRQEDALGKHLSTVFKVISEETGKSVKDPVKKAIEEGSFYGLADRTLLVAKEGAKMPVDIIGSAIKDDRDNIMGVALIFYDIIERNRIYELRKT
jgi:PAS domain S-box-containing protein